MDRSARPKRPRVLYYSHDAVGLGHLSRVLAIAQALSDRRSDVVSLIATGATNPLNFPIPRNTDLIRLPTSEQTHLYRDLEPATDLPGVRFADSGLWQLRARILQAAAIGFAPDILCVDHRPEGIHGELLPAIAALKRANPVASLIAVLDDFTESPESIWPRWEMKHHDVLRSDYDRVVIRGDRSVFDAASAYRFPTDLLAKTSYSGYVLRKPEARTTADEIQQKDNLGDLPVVLVVTGSGRDGDQIVRTYLEAIRDSGTPEFHSIVVTGPALPERARRDIELLANDLPRVTLHSFPSDLPGYMQLADLVVTMAGYSTIAEILSLGKRALVIPRVKPWPEQRLRADRLSELGLVQMLHPDDLSPERMWTAILTALSSPQPLHSVDCHGAQRIAALMSEMIDSRRSSTRTG